MSRSALIAITLLVLGSFISGCATKIAVRSVEPGRVFVGATEHLAILYGEGRRSARETVFEELKRQARSRGYFSVDDRSEEGLVVRVAGRRVNLEGGENPLEAGHAGVRVDVVEWTSVRDTEEYQRTDEKGNKYIESVPVRRGMALLAITLFDQSGKAFLAEKEYEGVFSTQDTQASKDDVLEMAAKDGVRQLLDDITPVTVVNQVRLDDDDPQQEAIIKAAANGSLAQAAADGKRYFESNSNSASCAYNVAVFLDAMGNYAEALEWYDRALSLGNKDFYSHARGSCARRWSNYKALSAGEGGRETSQMVP